MAEFQEICKQWRRLCMSFEDKAVKDYRPCAELCPVGCNPVCGELCESTQEDVERFEAAVMSWAAKHPVVYPTWGQYFNKIRINNGCKPLLTDAELLKVVCTPIPADIAQKLGIEPKEAR